MRMQIWVWKTPAAQALRRTDRRDLGVIDGFIVPQGGSNFTKVGNIVTQAHANDHLVPAFLLVTSREADSAKMAAYAAALAASGLFEAHGGSYEFVGQPVNAVEGWPAGVGAMLARFPSQAAAEAFWFSAKYQQDIKPLRRGAGTFQAAVFLASAG